jgi:hypothetical protein
LILNHMCLLRRAKPTAKETSERHRCGHAERLSNSKQSTNIKTMTTSFTVVCLFPTALLPTSLPLTSKKSQPRGGPEDKVQNENQTHDKRLKES